MSGQSRPPLIGSVKRQLKQLRTEQGRSTRTYRQDNEPAHPGEGDIWVPKTGTRFIKQYINGEWYTCAISPIGTADLTDLCVTTAKINDLAVTEGKIGAGAVVDAKIGNDEVHDHHLNADTAGAGLTQDANGALQVGAGAGITVTADTVASKYDNTTIGVDGSSQLQVKDNALDTTKQTVAATQNVSSNTQLVHNNKFVLLVTNTGSTDYTCTVADGTYAGQPLRICVTGVNTRPIILDNADANLSLAGDWRQYGYYGFVSIDLQWNGTVWEEIRRSCLPVANIDGQFGFGNGADHIITAAAGASFASGHAHDVSGNQSAAFGDHCDIDADRCFASGKYNEATADADYGTVLGRYTRIEHLAEYAYASDRHATTGDCQHGSASRKVVTTATGTMVIPWEVPEDGCYLLEVRAVCKQSGTTACGGYVRRGLFVRDAAADVVQVGTTTEVSTYELTVSCSVTLTVTGANIVISMIGDAAIALRWEVGIHYEKVLYV